jgi:hypothetical protein
LSHGVSELEQPIQKYDQLESLLQKKYTKKANLNKTAGHVSVLERRKYTQNKSRRRALKGIYLKKAPALKSNKKIQAPSNYSPLSTLDYSLDFIEPSTYNTTHAFLTSMPLEVRIENNNENNQSEDQNSQSVTETSISNGDVVKQPDVNDHNDIEQVTKELNDPIKTEIIDPEKPKNDMTKLNNDESESPDAEKKPDDNSAEPSDSIKTPNKNRTDSPSSAKKNNKTTKKSVDKIKIQQTNKDTTAQYRLVKLRWGEIGLFNPELDYLGIDDYDDES